MTDNTVAYLGQRYRWLYQKSFNLAFTEHNFQLSTFRCKAQQKTLFLWVCLTEKARFFHLRLVNYCWQKVRLRDQAPTRISHWRPKSTVGSFITASYKRRLCRLWRRPCPHRPSGRRGSNPGRTSPHCGQWSLRGRGPAGLTVSTTSWWRWGGPAGPPADGARGTWRPAPPWAPRRRPPCGPPRDRAPARPWGKVDSASSGSPLLSPGDGSRSASPAPTRSAAAGASRSTAGRGCGRGTEARSGTWCLPRGKEELTAPQTGENGQESPAASRRLPLPAPPNSPAAR